MMTNAQMIQMEARHEDSSVRFTINYARNQYGNRIGRKVAEMIASGRSVQVAQGEGFFVDGRHVPVSWEPGKRFVFEPEAK